MVLHLERTVAPNVAPDVIPESVVVSDALLEEINQRPGMLVDDEFGGRVFEAYDATNYHSAALQTILTRAGMVFVRRDEGTRFENTRALYPGPKRAHACCQANDIPIKFVTDTDPNKRDIPGKVFAEVVSSGHHAVGAANLYFYYHDLSNNDHFPAVIVGGKRLINWLVANTPADRDVADTYDRATHQITMMIHELTGHNNSGNTAWLLSTCARAVLLLLKNKNDPDTFAVTPQDQTRDYELRKILYDGFKKCGLHYPELIPAGRWSRMGRTILWNVFRK